MRRELAGPLLIATRSIGKLREIRPMFAAAGLTIIDLARAGIAETSVEDTLENGATFEANALAKARYFREQTGLPIVADDSGIEVVALDGAPGVYSKRWSGRPDLQGQALDDANNDLLLARLADVDDRRARYVCVAAFCGPDVEFVTRGEVSGRITRVARGTGGFGYDPYFECDELARVGARARTFGEVDAAEKARVSHRGRAFAELLRRLQSRTER
jgi:XTP/dITP diphosphohydrolase